MCVYVCITELRIQQNYNTLSRKYRGYHLRLEYEGFHEHDQKLITQCLSDQNDPLLLTSLGSFILVLNIVHSGFQNPKGRSDQQTFSLNLLKYL